MRPSIQPLATSGSVPGRPSCQRLEPLSDHGLRGALVALLPRASTARTSATGRLALHVQPHQQEPLRAFVPRRGIWLTADGGQSFTHSTYTNEMTGQTKRTTFGVSLHPDAARRTIFGAVGTGSSYVMVRSLDAVATWDLPLGTGTRSDGNLIAFDLDDPAYVFWGRHATAATVPVPGR